METLDLQILRHNGLVLYLGLTSGDLAVYQERCKRIRMAFGRESEDGS